MLGGHGESPLLTKLRTTECGIGDLLHVIVVGCGRVGSEVARKLEELGHTIAVVDKNHQAFRRLPKTFTGQRVVGFGFDRDHLIEAGVENAGALVAVTNGDNSNILTARVGREAFGLERVVARIYDPRRAVVYQRLGIPTVATVAWTTEQVLARLFPSDQDPNWVDSSANICLVSRVITPPWIQKPLSKLNSPERFWLTAITRLGKGLLVSNRVVGQDGDRLHFVSTIDAIPEIDQALKDGVIK